MKIVDRKVLCSVVIGIFFSLLSFAVVAQVVIEKRPFAIFSDTLFQNTDGWFDISEDIQKIGIFVKNTGELTLSGVEGNISFEEGSGISVIDGNFTFGDLQPNVPVLGVFEASFSSSVPDKYDFILELSNSDGYLEVISRKAFIAKSSVLGEKSFSVTVPEGTITVEYISFLEGERVESLMAPTQLKWTMIPSSPFSGQFSEIPFNDPWWKAFGIGVAIGGGINMVIDGVAEVCGGDYMDSSVEKINAGLIATGGGAAAADAIDPFRRGEANTFPQDGELTIREEVVMTISYDGIPIAQDAFTGEVSWEFTRFTTTGASYTFGVVEDFENDIHHTVGREILTYQSGEDFVVTARIEKEPEKFLKGSEAYVIASLSRQVTQTRKEFIYSIVMTDDGKNGDISPLDGTYTGIIQYDMIMGIPKRDLIVDVFAQDVNSAKETDPPLVAATNIGGFLISHPTAIQGISSDQGMSIGVTSSCPIIGKPLLVTLASFTVKSYKNNKIELELETATEIKNAGFRLWRGIENGIGGYEPSPLKELGHIEFVDPEPNENCSTKIQGQLKEANSNQDHKLISAVGNSTESTCYSFTDTSNLNDGTYYYLLEDIDDDGKSTFHCDHIDAVKVGQGPPLDLPSAIDYCKEVTGSED